MRNGDRMMPNKDQPGNKKPDSMAGLFMITPQHAQE